MENVTFVIDDTGCQRLGRQQVEDTDVLYRGFCSTHYFMPESTEIIIEISFTFIYIHVVTYRKCY